MRMTFVLPFAAPGVKTMAAFYDDKGVEVQLPLDGQKYVVVEPDANKRASLKALLCKNGFLLAGEEPAEAKPGPAVSKEEIILAHPDGYVDAEFTVNFGRKQHVVKLEGGRFGTLDLKLVKHLIEKGFTVQNPHAYERALEAKE